MCKTQAEIDLEQRLVSTKDQYEKDILYWKTQTHTIHMAFNQMFKECNEADAELKAAKKELSEEKARREKAEPAMKQLTSNLDVILEENRVLRERSETMRVANDSKHDY